LDLEASTNNSTWTTLSTHTNDIKINSMNGIGKGNIPSTTSQFSYFRIRMTGPNSSNYQELMVQNFEIYGAISK